LDLLQVLAERGCNRVLWECGPALAAAALQQGCVQELAVVIAPKLLGGTLARTPLGDLGFTEMDKVMALSDLHAQRLGRDLLLEQRLI
jgi:diaminohydroxyphosphoribosylaminopyrimidine deaminase/5-amino-6-(5-phosphoribosylamino)uracil reductase